MPSKLPAVQTCSVDSEWVSYRFICKRLDYLQPINTFEIKNEPLSILSPMYHFGWKAFSGSCAVLSWYITHLIHSNLSICCCTSECSYIVSCMVWIIMKASKSRQPSQSHFNTFYLSSILLAPFTSSKIPLSGRLDEDVSGSSCFSEHDASFSLGMNLPLTN